MDRLRSTPMFVLLLWFSTGCATTGGRAKQTPPEESASGRLADVAIRLRGDLDNLVFPAEPAGANRMLTVTVRGGRPVAVWLAPNEEPRARTVLTKVDEGEYQINLYGRSVYEALSKQREGSFRVFVELPTGETARSVSIRYALTTAAEDLDFSWDKATTTLYQRSVRAFPGSQGRFRLTIGDITAGQVLVSVYGPRGTHVVDLRSMRPGNAFPIAFAQRTYMLVLDRLVNLLVGRDFAVFSLVSVEAWRRDRINRLLAAIEASDATFIRNDEELGRGAFVTLLRTKLGAYGHAGLSVDEFIERIATGSQRSGEPYRVRTADGEVVAAAAWMRQLATVQGRGTRRPEPVE